MTFSEDRVQELKRELEVGIAEIAAENPEVGECDIAFDLSRSLATTAPRADAEEFLRREWGYVPEAYRAVAG